MPAKHLESVSVGFQENDVDISNHSINDLLKGPTCDSYGRKAMLISFRVFINLAHVDLHNSLNSSSGHAEIRKKTYNYC